MSKLPANISDSLGAMRAVNLTMKAASGGSGDMYLRLLKTGLFVYGPDATEVEEGSHWAINPTGFTTGYVAWENDPKKPAAKLGELMRAATDPPITPDELPDLPPGGRWDQQMGLTALCLDGEDKGVSVIFTTTSKGGLRAVNDMLGKIIARVDSGETDTIVPVITMDSDSYTHKRYGQVFTPLFEISSWESFSNATPETAAAAIAAEPAEPAEPEPAAPTRRKRRVRAA